MNHQEYVISKQINQSACANETLFGEIIIFPASIGKLEKGRYHMVIAKFYHYPKTSLKNANITFVIISKSSYLRDSNVIEDVIVSIAMMLFCAPEILVYLIN